MTEQTKDQFCGAILAIALGGLLILALSGCVMVDSTLALKPSMSANLSAYNRGGVVEAVSQQESTNGVHEIWTDSRGGGELDANVQVDPDLPALPALE